METFSFAATAMAATAVIEILENKKIAINRSDLSDMDLFHLILQKMYEKNHLCVNLTAGCGKRLVFADREIKN